jgi:Cu/Ag efflux protein CusF
MKKFIALVSFAALSFSPALAGEMTKGIVKKVDEKQMKVTIKHEELKNLEMPAMTMVFAVGDPAMLEKLKPDAEIMFAADRVNGRITLTEVQ